MSTDVYTLASAIAMRYCPDPVAAMRSWGFKTPTDTIDTHPGMALDALPRNLRRAHDQLDPELQDRILQFLQSRLDPDDFADLCEIIGVDPPPVEEDPDNTDEPNTEMEAEREAQDEPPPFPARPRPGGAQDASLRRLHKLMNRVTVDTMGIQPDPRRVHQRQQAQLAAQRDKDDQIFRAGGIAMDAGRSVKPFSERFPNAGRVGQI
jgi:hypothetical protein